MSVMQDRSRIFRTKSFVRSYFLPVFTLRQAVFLLFILSICLLLVLFGGPYGSAAAIILAAASAGALSISSPSVLIMRATELATVHAALKEGGWIQTTERKWRRREGPFWTWENDEVAIYQDEDVLIVFGPLFTLRQLRSSRLR